MACERNAVRLGDLDDLRPVKRGACAPDLFAISDMSMNSSRERPVLPE